MKLQVEFNERFKKDNDTLVVGKSVVMVTPNLNKDYWIFRVKLHKDQSIVDFPKFGLIGIGFAIEEEDGNTNLPASCDPEYLYNHIECNKKYPEITKEMAIKAIKLLKPHCKRFLAKPSKN